MGFSKYEHPERAVFNIFLLCHLGSGWLKSPEMWPLNSVIQIFHPVIRIGQLLKTSRENLCLIIQQHALRNF